MKAPVLLFTSYYFQSSKKTVDKKMYVTSNTSRMAKISASKIFAVYPIVTDTCSLCKMIINVPISAKFLSKIQAHMGLSTSKQQSSTVLHNFLSSNS
jgi:hypothetical protein